MFLIAASLRVAALIGVITLLSGIVTGCGGCPIVDYTVPPPLAVLGPADAVVIASVAGIRAVADGRIEADLALIDVLYVDAGLELSSEEPLQVGAYDDPCSRRSGLESANGGNVVVVLRWVGMDNGTWSVPWQAYPVFQQNDDFTLTFLDTGDNLNQRIDQIMPSPTIEGLIEAVSRPDA